MRWIFLSLALIFGAAQSYEPPPRPAKAGEKLKTDSKEGQKRSAKDEHRTEKSPLNGIQTQKTKEHVERDRKEREDKAFTDWWTMIFTGLAALFTLTLSCIAAWQLFMFRRQLNLMKDGARDAADLARAAKVSADAAKISTESTQTLERPYVFVHDIHAARLTQNSSDGAVYSTCRIFGLDAIEDSTIVFRLKNHGRTPATLKEVKADCGIFDTYPASGAGIGVVDIRPGYVIGIGEVTPFTDSNMRNVDNALRANVRKGEARLLLYGTVRYVDIFGIHWIMGFCYEYNIHGTGFGLSENEKLNYAPKQYFPESTM